MQLRDYQREAIDATYKFWLERDGNPVIVLPTGTGKTVLFAALIKELDEEMRGLRVLLLAHRAELLMQAENKLQTIYEDADIGVYCAGIGRKEIEQNITIASRDSIINKLDDLGKIDLVIIDEAHRINNKDEGRYRQIIEHLRKENGNIGVLGVTATDYRAQKSDGNPYIHGASRIFSGVSFSRPIKWFIDNGYLCKMSTPRTTVEIDTSNITTVAGDFNQKQLASAAEAEVDRCCKDLAQHVKMTDRKSTVVFCASVLHAEMVADIMGKDYYLLCAVIHGKMDRDTRAGILERFESGHIGMIANVGVLTEGWDAPRVDCIALMRPTKSLGLFMQMIGRGTRTFEGKEYCLLLDYGGCIDRFGPIDVARPVERKPEVRTKDCEQCGEINSFYARKCPNCSFQFQANPMKECGYCETPNPPSAVRCIACGEIFPRDLISKASKRTLFSTERDHRFKYVESMSMEVHNSNKTGRDYVRVVFNCGPFDQYSTVMCLGYPGYAGEKAQRLAASFYPSMGAATTTPEHFVHLWKTLDKGFFCVPKSIMIDFNSKYQDVVRYGWK